MARRRIGIWLIGAQGGVGTTAAVGLALLQRKLTASAGLVSSLPRFQALHLADWGQFVIGGHEIRRTSYYEQALGLHQRSGVFDADLLRQCRRLLGKWDANIRPGTLVNADTTVASLAGSDTASAASRTAGDGLPRRESPAAAFERVANDLREFQRHQRLSQVVVVNIASTEPPADPSRLPRRWPQFRRLLERTRGNALPTSTIYAAAALDSGYSYINFTPSLGSALPALEDLALERGTLHMGQDGKTGETLLKSVLAPMFAARHLEIMSWVGHNIFGNLDGKVLDDPAHKQSKVRSKDHLLAEILGYRPQTHVSIEYIESLDDWKTAWDHIHFRGFLGTKMALQFTWQGCDSLLAAPLVLDLVRFTEREARRGKAGLMPHLASFFKSPQGVAEQDFFRQYRMLEQWADEVMRETAARREVLGS